MNESPSNIPSIMMSSAPTESDAEDVNDFLRRIQELSQKRDQEDEERNRKLEEEIMQGRRERQARRAGSYMRRAMLMLCFFCPPAFPGHSTDIVVAIRTRQIYITCERFANELTIDHAISSRQIS